MTPLQPLNKKLPVGIQETTRSRFLRLSRFSNVCLDKFHFLSLFVSYFQLITCALQLSSDYIELHQTWISDAFKAMEDIVNLNVLGYTSSNENLLISCSCVLLYFLILILCFLTTIYQSLRTDQSSFFLSKVWSFLIQIHPNLLFLPINNICLYVQAESKRQALYDPSETFGNELAHYSSMIVLIINTLFAFLPYGFLFDILPSSDPLCSKSFLTDYITLCQKLFVPLFANVLPKVPFTPWLTVSLNFILSFLRSLAYLYILPKYHYTTLAPELYLTNFCCVCSTLTFLTFMMKQANSDRVVIDFEGALIINIVLCPLSIMHSRATLLRLLRKVMLTSYTKLNVYQALHKTSTLKVIEKRMKLPTKFQSRFDISYYHLSIIHSCTEDVFCQRNSEKNLDLNNKSEKNQMKRDFLELLIKQFGSFDMLRLILAQLYLKNLDCYLMAVKILAQKEFSSSNARISAGLMHYHIQQKILQEGNIEIEGLNPTKYIMMNEEIDQLKEIMKKQLSNQNYFWREYSLNNPDIFKLQNYSRDNFIQNENISKKWSRFAQNINDKPPQYLFLLYAHYELLLNDSLLKAEEAVEKYNRLRGWKIDDKSKRGTARDDHLYDHENNFSVTIRTDPDKLGVVRDCSKSIEKALGHKRNEVIGSNIAIIMNPFMAERHNNFLQNYIKTGQSSFLRNLQSVFVMNRSGFLQKYSLLANIHPFLNKEIYLTGLFRLIPIHFEYILLTPEGEIDSCTEAIASVLGIVNRKVHINSICPTLLKHPDFSFWRQLKSNDNMKDLSVDHQDSDQLSEDQIYSTHRLFLRSNKKQTSSFLGYEMTKRQTIIESTDRTDIYERQKNIKNLNLPEKLELEFSPLQIHLDKMKTSVYYKCKVSQIRVRDSFMIALELESADNNVGGHGLKNKSHKVSQTNFNKEHKEKPEIRHEINIKLISPDFNSNTESKAMLYNLKEDNNEVNLTKSELLVTKNVIPNAKQLVVPTQNFEERVKNRSQQIIACTAKSSSSGNISFADKNILSNVENVAKVEYSSKKSRTLLLGFFMVFIVIIFLHVHVLISTNSSLKQVKALATTLDLANSRADTFAYLDRFAMACRFIEKGLIDRKSPLSTSILQGYVSLYKTMIPSLKTSNYQLLSAVRDIDKGFQGYFKADNIRLYDINPDLTRGSYQKFDTFTAINILVQIYFKLSGSLSSGSFLGSVDLAFILNNSMNDLLLETVNAVDVILREVEISIEDTLKNLSSYKVTCLVLVGVLLTLILYLSYWTYNSELILVGHLLGFSNENIQLIRNKLAMFEETLDCEDANELYVSYQANRCAYKTKDFSSEKSKTVKIFRSPRTKSTQAQYLKKVAISLLLLITYGIMAYLALQEIMSKIQTLEVRLKRLAKVQYIQYEITIMSLTLQTIAVQDSNSFIKNRPAEEEFRLDFEAFLNDIDNLIDVFKDEHGNLDSEVTPIFLNDACEYAPTSSKGQCLNAKKGSKVFGIVAILNRQYSIMKDIFYTFNSSNKSFSSQKAMAMDIMTILGPNSYFLRDILSVIIGLAREDYTIYSDLTNITLSWSVGIGLLSTCGICMVIWRFVILYYIQFLTRFKRKVKLIPISMVLKNPVLKGVLINLSRGKLLI